MWVSAFLCNGMQQVALDGELSGQLTVVRDRPFNLKGGLWSFVSFRIFFSDNTSVRILILFVVQSAKFFSRIQH